MSWVEIDSIDDLDYYCKLVIKAVDKHLDASTYDVASLPIRLADHRQLTQQLGLESCAEVSRRGVVLRAVHDEL